MKKLLLLLSVGRRCCAAGKAAALPCLLFLALTCRATPYTVTNDLPTTFQILYWTNNNGSYVFSLQTNLPSAGTNLFNVSTNGIAGLGVMPTNATAVVLVNWTNLQMNSDFLSDVFAQAMGLLQPAVETVPQTQLILNSYFITGAYPTYANYKEWQDTMFWYINSIYTNSLLSSYNASNAAAQFNAQPYRAYASVGLSQSPPYVTLIGGWGVTNVGVKSFSRNGGTGTCTTIVTNFFSGGTLTDTYFNVQPSAYYGFGGGSFTVTMGSITISNTTLTILWGTGTTGGFSTNLAYYFIR